MRSVRMLGKEYKYVLHLLLLAFLLLGASSARAAAPAGLTLKAEPFFNGHFKFGEWLPIRISLANDGPPLRGQVRAETTQSSNQSTYLAPVELPTGARKRVTLYVQPPSFASSLRVRLLDGERELDSQSVDVTVERNSNYVVGVMVPRAEPFAVLNTITLSAQSSFFFKGPIQSAPRTVKAIPVQLADIPDRPEGLRALDALVISDVDTSEFSAEQKRALSLWIEQGGRLVVGGGASAARTLAGLPDELVKDFRTTTAAAELQSLTALSKFAEQEVRVPGPFVAAFPAAGRALIEQDNRPLLVEQRWGEGHVNYAALDLSASPFDAWAGTAHFWEKLLAPGSAYPANVPVDVSPRAARANGVAYALQNLPALDLPSLNSLAILLVLYIALVGPLNYFVLRRLHKLEWGWITIPALTLLFSAVAFQVSYSIRGSDVIVNQISIITLSPRAAAQPMQTYVGIFSPERSAYSMSFPGRTLVSPVNLGGDPWSRGGATALSGAEIVEGEPTQVRGIQVNLGALQAFQTESAAPNDWKIDSTITLDGARLRGTLVNRTGETLEDAVIVNGSSFARLGALPPGQSKSIDLALQQSSGAPFPFSLFENNFQNPGPNGPARELQMRQQVLGNYFQNPYGPAQAPDRPTLIGWMRASPLDVQVTGMRWAKQQTSLVIAALNVQYPAGLIHLGPGTLNGRVVGTQGEAGVCGPTSQLSVNNGSATLEYRLPEELMNLRVKRLTLTVNGGSAQTVELADRTGEWIKLDSPIKSRTELTDPARFVSADGAIRVRVSNSGGGGNCASYDLELEGENGS